jgi:hypothetical protein
MAEKTSQKKVVGRTVAIALGLVCIVLLAGLGGAIVVYTPMINNLESQTAEKDNTISSLNNTISSLNRQISVLQNTLNQNNSDTSAEIAALNAQISSLTNMLYLNASGVLVYNQAMTQDAGAYTTIWNDILNIAGYVTVAVQSSSNTTYVAVAYSTLGVYYNNNVTVGTSGTAAFSVLPGLIEIRVGNTDLVDPVTATVTATYYY